MLGSVEAIFSERHERFIGEDKDGQVVRDIDKAFGRLTLPWDTQDNIEQNLISTLLIIPQGTRTAFDRKTHRKVTLRTQRLVYIYRIAQLLENRLPEEITNQVLDHLENAQQATWRAWGLSEMTRLSNVTLAELDKDTRGTIGKILGKEVPDRTVIQDLPEKNKDTLIVELGRRSLTAVYRQLILGIISELWVEYLTQMEALRVSINLEAYAQRDPLVQYKSKAFELFKQLLFDMRQGVVNRMFTYRPRDLTSVQATISRNISPAQQEITQTEIRDIPEKQTGKPVPQRQDKVGTTQPSSSKRKRRRRRK